MNELGPAEGHSVATEAGGVHVGGGTGMDEASWWSGHPTSEARRLISRKETDENQQAKRGKDKERKGCEMHKVWL